MLPPQPNKKPARSGTLAGFFVRQFGQICLPWVIPPSAIKIKAFPPRIIVCRRVHVTRLAHGNAMSVRQAFRDHHPAKGNASVDAEVDQRPQFRWIEQRFPKPLPPMLSCILRSSV